MGTLRRSRTERPKKRAGRLTSRDLQILEAVGRMRVATTDQLTALFFGDRSTASRRLAVLLALGLLKVHVQELNAPNLYTLSKRGLECLIREGLDPESLHEGRVPRGESLEHLRVVNDLRVALVRACEGRDDVTLDLFLGDHDLRRAAGQATPPFVPDALVRLTRPAPSLPLGLAFEIDLGGESASYIAQTKARTTLALAEARMPLWGLDRWRPVLLAPSAARLRSLALAIEREGGGALWLGSDFPRLTEDGILGVVFARLREIAETPKGQALPYTLRLLTQAETP